MHGNLAGVVNVKRTVPKESPKPQPLGNFTVLFLFTTCTVCAIFLLWRKSASLRTVVAHQYVTVSSLSRFLSDFPVQVEHLVN